MSTVQTTAAASFSLSIKATSGSFTSTLSIPVVVSANSFTLTAAQSALSIKAASTGQVSVIAAPVGVFNSAINLVWTLPSGVTVSGSKVVVPGNGSVVATFTVSSSAKTGTYSATLSATGGGVDTNGSISLTIAAK